MKVWTQRHRGERRFRKIPPSVTHSGGTQAVCCPRPASGHSPIVNPATGDLNSPVSYSLTLENAHEALGLVCM